MSRIDECPIRRGRTGACVRLLYGAVRLLFLVLALLHDAARCCCCRAAAPATAGARELRALSCDGGHADRSEGLEHLPQGQCVIVANHASYLDGLVMTAALPPRFGFVIKREMSRVPLRVCCCDGSARSSSSASTATAARPMRGA